MNNISKQYLAYYQKMSQDTFNTQLEKFLAGLPELKELTFTVPGEEDILNFFSKDYKEEDEFTDMDWRLNLELLPAVENIYKQANLPLKVLDQSLEDLYWRLNEHLKNFSQLGLTAEDKMWLARIYHLRIFKLGSLQFEWLPFEENQALMEKFQGNGQGVISVHIMYGQDISRPSSLHSFAQALDFFDSYDYNYFYCQSWLLYPKNEEFLKANSRILDFMNLFQIIEESQQVDLPYKFIFYKKVDQVTEEDIQTSLQRYAYDQPENLGIGTGIISQDEMRRLIDEKE